MSTRRTDPETSHAAEQSHDAKTLRDIIHAVFREYPRGLIDEELILAVPGPWADSGIRGRRNELARDGKLVADGTRKNSGGRECTIWRLATEADQPAKSQGSLFGTHVGAYG